MSPLDNALAKGLAYVRSAQKKDGSFTTQLSYSPRPFLVQHEVSTTFLPSLLLGALACVGGSKSIRDPLAIWLLEQKSKNWSFNYWPVDAPQRKTRPYPDDLDDTFCALIGLYLHDPGIIDSTCLAKVVRLLLATEQEVGGPYRTWLVSKDAPAIWQPIDVAVNANIAYFLRLVAEPLPKLHHVMEQASATQNIQSPYYPAPEIIAYYMARAAGKKSDILADYLKKRQKNGHWETPASTALAVSALNHLGHDTASAAQYLLSQQLPDGSWPAEAIWVDEEQTAHKQYAGSPALTTALVLEALSRSKKDSSPQVKRNPPSFNPEFLEVIAYAQNCLQRLDDPLHTRAIDMLTKLQQGETGQEIVLLPYLFAESLISKSYLPKELYILLGQANVFGWMAYTIYDDFLDEEGDPALLPVANIAMRQSLAYFVQILPEHSGFQHYVRQTFDRIDAANAWEVTFCRFVTDGQSMLVGSLPDYKHVEYLAERAIGHGLTPVAVLLAAGISLDDARVQLVQKGLKHYIAARQLHDDLHDWQQDFQKGHVSYVVAHILRDLEIPKGRHMCRPLLLKMEHQFWHYSLQALCEKLRRQLRLSRQAYLASELLKSESPFLQLLDCLEQSIAHTLAEQQKAIQFLAAYRKA